MAAQTIYLITGANRGIGRAMAESLLQREGSTVVAGVRDVSSATSQSLNSLSAASGSKIVVVLLDVKDSETALAPALENAGIDRLDVVISNAGRCSEFKAVDATPIDDIRQDFDTNFVGTFSLFRACLPYLRKSPEANRKFVIISSLLSSSGSMEQLDALPGIAYGASKSAVNWLGKRLSLAYAGEGIKVGIVEPGFCRTDMGHGVAAVFGMAEPPMAVEDSAQGVLQQVHNLSPETSGKFMRYNGQQAQF